MSPPELSVPQATALRGYLALVGRHPGLFSPRTLRRLVLDEASLTAWAAGHGTMLGVVAETPYIYLLVDLVESDTATGETLRYPYMRVVSRAQLSGGTNVVVLATIADEALGRRGDVVLLELERHATGRNELELPRGFGEAGLTPGENALKELQEETGYVGEVVRMLGATVTDTGLMDITVHFVHVAVTGLTARHKADPREAVAGVRLMSPEAIQAAIAHGEIRDGHTVQALGLWRALAEG